MHYNKIFNCPFFYKTLSFSSAIFSVTVGISQHCYADILKHTKEIGLYHTNKKTQFIQDEEMLSPKSADFLNDKLVINALEGGKTLFYNINTWQKEPSISHNFIKPQFENIPKFPYSINTQNFTGKPVEMVHNQEKMWIPYYRLSWDTNSRNSSAIAQIDIKNHKIEKLIPSGSIPKMIRLSHDGKTLVSTHWGDNTVGLYSLKDNSIVDYHYIVVGNKLNIGNIFGDRDKNCGYCLRGTVFTKDDNYILIGKMGGGGIAVIQNNTYIGTITNVPLTPRHLVISEDGQSLYLSTCFSSEVAKISMTNIYQAIQQLKDKKNTTLSGWKTLKLGSSVRTIALSHDQKYVYAAMNDTSEIAVIDAQNMKLIEKHKISSYPVGLSVSEDDKYVVITEQGKNSKGGNHIDLFERN